MSQELEYPDILPMEDLLKPYFILMSVIADQSLKLSDQGQDFQKQKELFELIAKQAFFQVVSPSKNSDRISMTKLIDLMSFDDIKKQIIEAEKQTND